MSYLNLKNNSSKTSKTNTGFTLVEMMVAIAVFSIVMVAAMSALLNVIDANNKARAIKTAINNVNFALEGISRDMRMGTDYKCGFDEEPSGDCLSGGGNIISYVSPRADYAEKKAYYKFNKDDGSIEECL
ncbi:MAG: type II secretion system protein, partial [Candidatus Magasanikbacteria bacterium]